MSDSEGHPEIRLGLSSGHFNGLYGIGHVALWSILMSGLDILRVNRPCHSFTPQIFELAQCARNSSRDISVNKTKISAFVEHAFWQDRQ